MRSMLHLDSGDCDDLSCDLSNESSLKQAAEYAVWYVALAPHHNASRILVPCHTLVSVCGTSITSDITIHHNTGGT